MEIIFQGCQSSEEAQESLMSVLNLFKERYGISTFRQMHLNITLVDDQGDDVELVDNETAKVFNVFEVYKEQENYQEAMCVPLQLVVDNT